MARTKKILFYDIESTDLDADFGHMLAFGYKFLGDAKPTVLSMLDTNITCSACGKVDATSDAALVKQIIPIINSADVIVSWFGKGFDIKFINTRILDANLPPLANVPHIDLYFTARGNLKLTSNRLASVQDFLQLPTSKTPLTKRVWRRAQAGDINSIKYIVEHCEADVQVLQEAYERLKPYVRMHPHMGGTRGACRTCGARMASKGLVNYGGIRYRRVSCTACGRYDREKA